MKQDILINLAQNGIVYKDTTVLGIENENIVTNMVFKFLDDFVDGTGILEVNFGYTHHSQYVCTGNESGTYEIDGNTFTMPSVVSGDYLYYYKDLNQLTHRHDTTTTQITLTTGTSENKLTFVDQTTGYYEMTKGTDNYSLPIKNTLLLKKGKLYFNLRITETTTTSGTPIYKSNKFYLEVKDSINATDTIPEEYPSIIDILNNKLDVSNFKAGTNITITTSGNDITINSTGGSGGTSNYNELTNKPQINSVELSGNKSLSDLGIVIPTKTSDLTNNSGFIDKDVTNLSNYTKTSDLGALATKDTVNYNTDITNTPDLTTKVSVSDIINDVTHTDTNKPLSANMGKTLQDEIDNLKSRGRFLSLWNCVTGLPTTNPTTLPYTYQTGDYYIIGNIATGGCTHTITISGITPDNGGLLPEYDDKPFTVTFSFKNNVSTQYSSLSSISTAIGDEQQLEATGNIDTTYTIYGVFAGVDEETSEQMLALLDSYPLGQKMTILTESTATISTITDVVTGSVSSTNYKPTGASYSGTASLVVESSSVAIDDVYYYDGSTWKLQINTQKTITFANIAGQPTDNSNLASALNNKQDVIQYSSMPTASSSNAGKIVEYIGATGTYTNGYFYKCTETTVYTPASLNITTSGTTGLGTVTGNADTFGNAVYDNEEDVYTFEYRAYPSNITVVTASDGNKTLSRNRVGDTNGRYAWLMYDNSTVYTETQVPELGTEFFSTATEDSTLFISYDEVTVNEYSDTYGRWQLDYGDDIYEDVDLSEYGISYNGVALIGAKISVQYTDDEVGSNVYSWVQCNVQPATAWGSITGTLSSQTDLNTALNAKEDKILSIGSISGTAITLTADTLNTLSISANTTFTLPTITDGKFHQIMIFASVTGTPTITWGTSYFFNGEAPTIDGDTYNFIFEYDGTNWYAGALKKGVVS